MHETVGKWVRRGGFLFFVGLLSMTLLLYRVGNQRSEKSVSLRLIAHVYVAGNDDCRKTFESQKERVEFRPTPALPILISRVNVMNSTVQNCCVNPQTEELPLCDDGFYFVCVCASVFRCCRQRRRPLFVLSSVCVVSQLHMRC